MTNFFINKQNQMGNILSNFQCGFRKDFNGRQCLMGMIEKAKGVMDNGGHFNDTSN